jgi:hypothetical protein
MSSTWRGIILLQLTMLVYAWTKLFVSGWSYLELEELYMGSYNTFLPGIPASFGNLTKLVG